MTSARKITDTTTDRRQLSEDKRKFIRRVILDLFAAGSFQQVGIRDICFKAGVTPKTIYKHFGNKEALLIAAIEPDMRRLTDAMERAAAGGRPMPARMEAVGRAFFDFYFSNINVARIVFLNIPSAYFVSEPDFIQRDQLAVLKALVVEGQANGAVRRDMPAEILVEAIAGISMGTMFRLLTQQTLPDAAEAANEYLQLTGPLLAARD